MEHVNSSPLTPCSGRVEHVNSSPLTPCSGRVDHVNSSKELDFVDIADLNSQDLRCSVGPPHTTS